ncbi:hypothetical protein ACFE04_015496 [Oxalis oulophora]
MDSARSRSVWLSCLSSGFRTALACSIVGCITLYGPTSIKRQLAFPAFSYVTLILVITDATLGDTLYGCWLALYATVQTIGPAILTLWLVGPARLTNITTAVAVAAAAFIVVLPEGTHLKAKRIALGQIVITYVIGFINGAKTEPVMHPLRVAASTGVGVLACVLALMLPYPRLASYRVKQNYKLLSENASARLKLYVKAFCAEEQTSALAFISQAKLLSLAGRKLVLNIKLYQESMKWERLPFKFLRFYQMNTGERLQALDLPLRGMEMAVTTCTNTFPIRNVVDQHFKESLISLERHIDQTITIARNSTVPETNAVNITKFLQTLQTMPTTQNEVSSVFFLFCMKTLHRKLLAKQIDKSVPSSSKNEDEYSLFWSTWVAVHLNKKRLMEAFRCSLSLGLAVLFGLMYSKENGYWSGLPVAISMAAAREATFKVANVKAQGTVLGTVYGVFGCFVLERFMLIKFLSLIPWFIFTSFLRKSRMYGQAGGISAVIGAVLLLGRKNFGPPSEFAIARITETFIGLSCSVTVDLMFKPTRASSLAKIQLSKTLGALHDCVNSLSLQPCDNSVEKLNMQVNELAKFMEEAEMEPNFWFLPFHTDCYNKLFKSLSKMVDLLSFSKDALRLIIVEQESTKVGIMINLKELKGDLDHFKEIMCCLTKCLQDVSLIKSLALLDKELQVKYISTVDVESDRSNIFSINGSEGDQEIEKILNSYHQHSKDFVDKIQGDEDERKKLKSRMILNLSAFGYCMRSLTKEILEIKEGIEELVQWENPSSFINLNEISCKVRALYK